jgi:hypothetical protein
MSAVGELDVGGVCGLSGVCVCNVSVGMCVCVFVEWCRACCVCGSGVGAEVVWVQVGWSEMGKGGCGVCKWSGVCVCVMEWLDVSGVGWV